MVYFKPCQDLAQSKQLPAPMVGFNTGPRCALTQQPLHLRHAPWVPGHRMRLHAVHLGAQASLRSACMSEVLCPFLHFPCAAPHGPANIYVGHMQTQAGVPPCLGDVPAPDHAPR